MAGGGLVVHVWKEWGVQILVVTSFLLQVVLLIFGGFRRRNSSAVLLAFLWLSYLMADNIAVYALGHMTLESRPRDAGLVAFWATFFLLHLGGQDTITAFSMEDNQLWRRHLLTLVVQSSGAGYAIYLYVLSDTWTLLSATLVMFIVGFIKYGERVWALQRGNTDNFHSRHRHYQDDRLKSGAKIDREELTLLRAHYMFNVCKGSFANANRLNRFGDIAERFWQIGLPYKNDMGLYDLIEAELSLLYDLFYTKAQVVHSWQGYLIRAISLVGTVSAFLLFCFHDRKGGYNRVDVSITYLLLVGAIIMETTSFFRVVGSTWTCHYLHHRGWHRTCAMVMCLRRLLKVGRQRKWLHSIGQHNVLDYRTRNLTKCRNKIAEAVVPKKWWKRVNFSGNSPITVEFKKLVLDQVIDNGSETWSIRDAPGKATLSRYEPMHEIHHLYFKDKGLAECISIWHVATDIYLYCRNDQQQHQSGPLNTAEDDKPLVEAIKVLSNYMKFLMMHPSLLPGGVPQDLDEVVMDGPLNEENCLTSKEFARSLLDDEDDADSSPLAGQLLENERKVPILKVIFGVWVEFLCYAAQQSTDTSHLRQLGRGGEFLTVIRLVVDHIQLVQRFNKKFLLDGRLPGYGEGQVPITYPLRFL